MALSKENLKEKAINLSKDYVGVIVAVPETVKGIGKVQAAKYVDSIKGRLEKENEPLKIVTVGMIKPVIFVFALSEKINKNPEYLEKFLEISFSKENKIENIFIF